VSFTAITLCVVSQRSFIVVVVVVVLYFVMTQSGNFWIYPHILEMFENRVLRKIFGPRREEVEGGWKRQHNERVHILYASPNIIRVIKLRRMC
jgi:hypothetical protein